MLMRLLDVSTSFLATVARLGAGASVTTLGRRPREPLVLFDFEGCPYCRTVREALSMLDLDVLILPCPKGGTRFRREVQVRGGKLQFPYLHDPNTGAELYESDEIVKYLFATYGTGAPPLPFRLGILHEVTSAIAFAARPLMGVRREASRAPRQPLELWSFEASPFCRLVREKLSALELPYLLHNVAHGSPRRPEFVARSGRMMVPYLVDPNTGAALFESADIVAYLDRTYAEARAA